MYNIENELTISFCNQGRPGIPGTPGQKGDKGEPADLTSLTAAHGVINMFVIHLHEYFQVIF